MAKGEVKSDVDSNVEEEMIGVAHDWDRAMVDNNADAMALTHDVMTSEDFGIRVYGDTAVVTARGVSGGKYQGQPFREVERSSCVFVRQEGQWRCVLTHLSRFAERESR